MTDNTSINKGVSEREAKSCSGWGILLLDIALMILSLIAAILFCEHNILLTIAAMIYLCLIGPVIFCGLKIVRPNEALVLTLFGKYSGSIKKDGFYFVNPFSSAVNPLAANAVMQTTQSLIAVSGAAQNGADGRKNASTVSVSKKISLKAMTLDNKKQKVNDLLGNPIEVGIVVVWRVGDTAKAVFDVDNFETFVSIQADSALRDVVRQFPYDITDSGEDENEKSLRGSSNEVALKLKEDLQNRVLIAGLEIMDARITHLAYAPEIAAAMLQRQQASAIIAARQKIVEGAVGMVEMALDMLSKNEICELDEERKAQMVSNLLVVLCGSKEAQPIVNSGSIY